MHSHLRLVSVSAAPIGEQRPDPNELPCDRAAIERAHDALRARLGEERLAQRAALPAVRPASRLVPVLLGTVLGSMAMLVASLAAVLLTMRG